MNTEYLRQRARVSDEAAGVVITRWLRLACSDFRSHLWVSLTYGFGLVVVGWVIILFLLRFGLGWMILPLISGAMLLGPVVTVGLYRLSRRSEDRLVEEVSTSGQVFLVGVVMMILVLAWIRAATLLFAVFFGLHPFAGFLQTTSTLLSTNEGITLVVLGSLVGGLFASFGYAISVFALPMLVDREIDGFSAMGLSFNATIRNFNLMVAWGFCLTVLFAIGVATGFLALIVLFPILGFATWHAYEDLFEMPAND